MSNVVRLQRLATRERPGPGPMPDPLLRTLDLEIRRRIDGLLTGDFQAVHLGRGTELAQVRPYQAGDDVREIDWNVTARTQEPHVRVRVAERVLTTWLLLDVSPSMRFGTADRTKADVAEGMALAVSHIAARRGNRMGVLTFGTSEQRVIPPSPTRVPLLNLLTELRRREPELATGSTSLGAALKRCHAVARPGSAVVVVSDLRGPRDWRSGLMQLAAHHEVVVSEIRDPREMDLPDVGVVWMTDPETGREVRVNTSSKRLRARFSEAARLERDEVARLVRTTGADRVTLTTSGDWLRAFTRFLSMRKEAV